MVDHVVLLMKLVAVRLEPVCGILGKLHHYCIYTHHHGYRLLIIFFAIFVCVCVGCCRRCYSKQGTNSYSSREITIQSNIGQAEPVSSSSNNYNKTHIDAPPSYFDVAPNYIQEDDMPPPYPGENNT